jgi:protein gp37
MARSKIEWTSFTWNPVTGCTRVSAGCANCYAHRMAMRLRAAGNPRYKNGFDLTVHEDLVSAPLAWRQPRLVFVNSMSDLFHEDIPFDFIKKVFSTMKSAHWHTFQILTKRSARLAEIAPALEWPSNVWMGVTVELEDYTERIKDLLRVPSSVRFVSFEPLLGPIDHVELTGIDWAIVGGESGPRARPMKKEWVTKLHESCQATGVAFFFKQWGGPNKKKAGRILDDRTWDNMPAVAQPELAFEVGSSV